ncbi:MULTISPECIES: LapA family protein [Aliagarivorans]|uniref:LapA family protein n=1 Tax=Aliagarivorans TaxID=882379 RepID=UPI00146FAA75|nr:MULTISPECIES: lipopolysaccharide assembly protein LapA domain-containing protein [Aliagarivorans]
MRAIVSLFLLVVLFVLALAIGAQNDAVVRVNYLIAESELRLSWLMAGLFIAGFLACMGFMFAFYTKFRVQQLGLKRKLAKQQKHIAKLESSAAKGH